MPGPVLWGLMKRACVSICRGRLPGEVVSCVQVETSQMVDRAGEGEVEESVSGRDTWPHKGPEESESTVRGSENSTCRPPGLPDRRRGVTFSLGCLRKGRPSTGSRAFIPSFIPSTLTPGL